MKKVIFSMAVLGLVFASSCKKDDDNDEKSCTELTADITTATNAYNTDDSNENCIKLENALQAYVDSSCGTEEEDAQFTAVLSLLACE